MPIRFSSRITRFAFQGMCCTVFVWAGTTVTAQQPATESTTSSTKPRTVSRIFWQDTANNSIRWANLLKDKEWDAKPMDVSGFPKLDSEQCSLVQMEEVDNILLAGVHDHEDGTVQSGWVAIDCGVQKDAHGDHFHWNYLRAPVTKAVKLDTEQGNPAHVYAYDQRFYLANDKKNGVTMVDPIALASGKPAARFFAGGGGHITLAAVENKVCYSTWIDREGDNKGRVDVFPLTSTTKNGYSFHLPSGGIHGATANSGKVFFAPTDGVCWVQADVDLNHQPNSNSIHHIALGKDATDKPLRTGAFTNHRNWVLFVTGLGGQARLCMLDAQSPKPDLISFPLALEEGCSVTTPVTLRTSKGQQLAFVFQESKDGSKSEKLMIVQLDSDGDGKAGDVSLLRTIEVGASQIEGHGGHHELAFSPSGRLAYFSNPGSGSIWILSLVDFTVQAKLQVGGTPTRIVAVGG